MAKISTIVLKHAASLAAGMVVNRLLYKQLRKIDNPGFVTRVAQRQLEQGLKFGPVMATVLLVAEIALTVAADADRKAAHEQREADLEIEYTNLALRTVAMSYGEYITHIENKINWLAAGSPAINDDDDDDLPF